MEANKTEIEIINRLLKCRYLPGSFDKKFPSQINLKDVSPLQKWWVYKLGYKYRKQIKSDIYALICKNYLDYNPQPMSRKEADKILKDSVRVIGEIS